MVNKKIKPRKNEVEEEVSTELQFFDFIKDGYLLINKIRKATEIFAKKIEGHKRKIRYSKIKKQRSKKTPLPSKK